MNVVLNVLGLYSYGKYVRVSTLGGQSTVDLYTSQGIWGQS